MMNLKQDYTTITADQIRVGHQVCPEKGMTVDVDYVWSDGNLIHLGGVIVGDVYGEWHITERCYWANRPGDQLGQRVDKED